MNATFIRSCRARPCRSGRLDIKGGVNRAVRWPDRALTTVSLSAAPCQVTGSSAERRRQDTLLTAACGFVSRNPERSFDSLDAPVRRTGCGPGVSRTLPGVGPVSADPVRGRERQSGHPERRGPFCPLLGPAPRSAGRAAAAERALQALGRGGRLDLSDSMPETLAYGLRKRGALAPPCRHPRLLLCSRMPSSGLSEGAAELAT